MSNQLMTQFYFQSVCKGRGERWQNVGKPQTGSRRIVAKNSTSHTGNRGEVVRSSWMYSTQYLWQKSSTQERIFL